MACELATTQAKPSLQIPIVSELRAVHDAGGEIAFDRAARRALIATAAVIAEVRGRDRLSDIMDAIDVVLPR